MKFPNLVYEAEVKIPEYNCRCNTIFVGRIKSTEQNAFVNLYMHLSVIKP